MPMPASDSDAGVENWISAYDNRILISDLVLASRMGDCTPPWPPPVLLMARFTVVEIFAVEQAGVFKGCNHNFHQTLHKNQGRIKTLHCWILGTPEYSRYMDPDGT